MKWRNVLTAVAGLLLLNNSAHSETAVTYPSQLVKMIVPFGAGTFTDMLARVIADKLGELWKQPVIVEDRPGISGTISGAKSNPDGYTIMLISNGHVIADITNKNLPIDPMHDFAPVMRIGTLPFVLVASPDLPVRNLQELIDLAKEKPSKLNYGSVGLGSASFLAAELFKDTTKTNFVHVPYKGGADAITGVIRGDVNMYFFAVNFAVEFAKAGKFKPLAITGSARHRAMPAIPTFAEAGFPDFRPDAWFGIVVPVHTPRPIIDKINKDIGSVLRMQGVSQRLDQLGFDVSTSSTDEFEVQMNSDAARYRKLLKDVDIGAN